MQMLQGKSCSSNVELCALLVAPQAVEVVVGEQVTTTRQFQEEVQMLRRAVGFIELDDKGGITHPAVQVHPYTFPGWARRAIASQVSAARSSRS